MEHINHWLLLGMAGMVILGLALFSILSTRQLERIPHTRKQVFVEFVVESLDNFVVSIIGPKGRKHTPFIGTLFIYILCMNLLGLIPPLKSPTSTLSITAALALTVLFYYNLAGIRENGFRRWAKHFLGEPIWLAPLMLPIHLIGELARSLSLSVRLFGNIFGEETVLGILASMTFVIVPYLIAVPTQFPIMLFDVFVSFVQALIFSMLATVYVSIATAGAEEH